MSKSILDTFATNADGPIHTVEPCSDTCDGQTPKGWPCRCLCHRDGTGKVQLQFPPH